jgi:hypothetical protein
VTINEKVRRNRRIHFNSLYIKEGNCAYFLILPERNGLIININDEIMIKEIEINFD